MKECVDPDMRHSLAELEVHEAIGAHEWLLVSTAELNTRCRVSVPPFVFASRICLICGKVQKQRTTNLKWLDVAYYLRKGKERIRICKQVRREYEKAHKR